MGNILFLASGASIFVVLGAILLGIAGSYAYHPSSMKKGWIIFFLILLIVPIILIIMAFSDPPKIDNGETEVDTSNAQSAFGSFGGPSDVYKSIGHGPLVDKSKISTWLNRGEKEWTDGNGQLILLPEEKFRNVFGFIPPSFVYYPYGQSTNDYNVENYKGGREECMKACSVTQCAAVQTEVPQNCTQAGEGACGNNAQYACTLFYKDIQNADNAYKALNPENLGIKYYENSSIPTKSNLSFCPPEIASDKKFSTRPGATAFCSCTGTSCGDPNCCVVRDLLVTEYIKNRRPYYSLPITVNKVDPTSISLYKSVFKYIQKDENGAETCCGKCGDKYISCKGHKCANKEDKACYVLDTNPSVCTGDVYAKDTSATMALSAYNKSNNYDDLYKSCYYKNNSSVLKSVQSNCDTGVIRGCFGAPSIIGTSSLSGDYGACSAVIPQNMKCQENQAKLSECKDFPYSCGSDKGTNSLWVKS